ncbi:MAG: TIGR03862 family flavoprotein [Bacteroidota bacterium]
MSRKQIAIIGGGPAGMMAADVLSPFHDVHIYDKEKGVGQKFLVAGKGGFNITNSLQGEVLFSKYTPAYFLRDALLDFGTAAVRDWLLQMGIPTFEGTSGRIFPEKGITPADVLGKLKKKLLLQGVEFHLKHALTGFDTEKNLVFKAGRKNVVVAADYFIFALGGASWKVTGSNGDWRSLFEANNFNTKPFQSSNCGINIEWPEHIKVNHAGKPLKNIAITANGVTEKGEALITEYGLEGNVIYPLVPEIREALSAGNNTEIRLDLKHFNTEEQLVHKVAGKTSYKTKNYAEIFKLNSTQLSLIKSFTPRETFLSPELFARSLKQIVLKVQSLRPVEEAISTVGGMDLNELNADFSFKTQPNYFAIGEMLDWDAPTGGFLLQAGFSMGHWVGKCILAREQILI